MTQLFQSAAVALEMAFDRADERGSRQHRCGCRRQHRDLHHQASSGLIQRAPVPRDLGLPVVALRSFLLDFLQGATYSDNLERANTVPARKTSSELGNVSEMKLFCCWPVYRT